MSIQLNGQNYSTDQVIQAIAASNDPAVDLSSIEAALAVINTRLTSIESKLASLPTTWHIH